MKIAQRIDTLLFWLKWPVALLSLVYFPGCLEATWNLLVLVIADASTALPVLFGFAVYCIAWWFMFRRAAWGSWFSTLEHELTHAIVALITFHPVKSIRASWNRGGSMSYYGKGNWLITLSPYFFPTLSVLAILLLSLSGIDVKWSGALIGVTLAYNITSTCRETHSGQTDLRETGFLFSWTFLPAAILLSYGACLAFACGGTTQVIVFLRQIID